MHTHPAHANEAGKAEAGAELFVPPGTSPSLPALRAAAAECRGCDDDQRQRMYAAMVDDLRAAARAAV
jgi:hypothetical protein